MCARCAVTRPYDDPDFLARPEVQVKIIELSARVGSEVHLRCCDSANDWDWRAFLRERQAALRTA